jgi:hypothetical protein
MAKPEKLPPKRNPVAMALRSPALRPKVVPSGKLYDRRKVPAAAKED